MLSGLGVAGDVERDVTFVEDLSELAGQVVDDLYLRKFFRRGGPPFSLDRGPEIGSVAVENPSAAIEPRDGDAEQVWTMRRRLAQAVRDEVEIRKRPSGGHDL